MTYALVIKQKGNGCDYMINCGIDFHILKSENLIDAKEEAKNLLIGKLNKNWECEDEIVEKIYTESVDDLEWVKIVEVKEYLPLDIYIKEISDIVTSEKLIKDRDREERRKLYEKLKQEFEC